MSLIESVTVAVFYVVIINLQMVTIISRQTELQGKQYVVVSWYIRAVESHSESEPNSTPNDQRSWRRGVYVLGGPVSSCVTIDVKIETFQRQRFQVTRPSYTNFKYKVYGAV